MFQSTLPRGERPPRLHHKNKSTQVSIHAPAWGATERCKPGHQSMMFQSTLPRGERPGRLEKDEPTNRFNPRSRVGSDEVMQAIRDTLIGFNPRSRVGSDFPLCSFFPPFCVSIHAPAWGATQMTAPVGSTSIGFNPRSRVGSDRQCHRCNYRRRSFNPRSRVGSDGGC